MSKKCTFFIMGFLLLTSFNKIFTSQPTTSQQKNNKTVTIPGITRCANVKFLVNNTIFVNGDAGIALYDIDKNQIIYKKERIGKDISVAASRDKREIVIVMPGMQYTFFTSYYTN